MSSSDNPPPFTREFAQAACLAHQAVSKLCKLAGATHVVTFSGTHVDIGDNYNGRRISLNIDDGLIDLAYGEDDAK